MVAVAAVIVNCRASVANTDDVFSGKKSVAFSRSAGTMGLGKPAKAVRHVRRPSELGSAFRPNLSLKECNSHFLNTRYM